MPWFIRKQKPVEIVQWNPDKPLEEYPDWFRKAMKLPQDRIGAIYIEDGTLFVNEEDEWGCLPVRVLPAVWIRNGWRIEVMSGFYLNDYIEVEPPTDNTISV
jgi:hypothetical protein